MKNILQIILKAGKCTSHPSLIVVVVVVANFSIYLSCCCLHSVHYENNQNIQVYC